MLAAACGILAACAQQTAVPEDVAVEWRITPASPAADAPTLAEVTLLDRARAPIRGATLQVEGHMAHPGMAPVLATAAERGVGVYQAELRFTMPGSWILLVTGRLPDGRRVEHRIDVSTTTASSPD
jgi:hypothetical protein